MEFPIVFIFYLIWGGLVDAIGVSSHIDVAHRAREYFEFVSEGVDYHEILMKHEDAFQAGAPYPDAYYSGLCFDGIFHSISEDTHWTPFINVTVNYIRREYPKPWSEETEKLVAFFLSIISHQVADVNWHSLGIDQGFLTTMGHVNYHGSFPKAHSDGDFGGDVLNLYGLDLDYISKVRQWLVLGTLAKSDNFLKPRYVPTQDLYNIYLEMYGEERMPIEVIENCTALLFLARLGENIGVVDKLYPIYAKRSTFLADRLQDYFLGGMDDMATWSTNVWKHAIDMLDRGTDVCDLPNNPIYITCNTLRYFKKKYKTYVKLKRSIQRDESALHSKLNEINDEKYIDNIDETEVFDNVKIQHEDNGIYLSPKRKLRQKMKRKLKAYAKMKKISEDQAADKANQDIIEPSYLYNTAHSYARFGESLQKGDFNADGYMDIAIGAPGYSIPENLQQGRVYIVYGSSNGLPLQNGDIEHTANVTLSCLELNGRFGTAMATSDINADGIEDLIVSAPSVGSDILEYHGVVYAFFGDKDGIHENWDIQIQCEQRYCNLGWSLSGGDTNSDGFRDIIIGAPFAPAGGEQRGFVGILYANTSYSDKQTVLTELDLDWMSTGEQDYEWFGYSVTSSTSVAGDNWVFIGAPTYRKCYSPDCSYNINDTQAVGRVYGYIHPDVEWTIRKSGTNEFDQFGFDIHASKVDNSDVLFISAVTQDSEDDEFGNATQNGVVYAFKYDDMDGSTILNGDKPFGRFGSSIIVHDFDGNNKDDVLVTAPFYSESYFSFVETGRAYIFNDIADQEGQVISASEANIVMGAIGEKYRFGYSTAFITEYEETFLLFGMPHTNTEGLLAGQVAVYKF